MSSCRTTRAGLAPSAPRRASSRCREPARVSIRFATSAQPMSSTMATAPMSTRIMRLVSPTTSSASGVTGSVRPFRNPASCSGGGYCLMRDGLSNAISARACSMPTPGFSRATSVLLYMLPHPCRSRGVNAMGSSTDAGSKLRPAPRGGNWKRSLITPTMVYGWRSSEIVRPTACGSRPNARDHKP